MSWSTPYAGYTPGISTPAFQAYGYSTQGYPVYSAPLTPPPGQAVRPPQPRPSQRPASVVPVAQPPPSPVPAQAASVPVATTPIQQPVLQSQPLHQPQAQQSPHLRQHAPPALSGALHLNGGTPTHPSNPEWTPVGKPKLKAINSADVVEDTEKRQYHIGLAPGEVAPNIILVGDPARSARVADLFDAGSVTTHVVVREFVTFTGTYKGIPVSVISTGIGPPNVEIVLVELSRVVEPTAIIRVGSCGALQQPINIGDLVISTGAVRLEDTSLRFVESGYPSIAHHEAIIALQIAARRLGFTHHTGITASSSGFYGGQGRQVPGFPVNDLEMVERLAARNVYNFEMESSTLFTLASLKGWRSGTVCAAFANRPNNIFIQTHQKEDAEKRAIITGLEALVIIDKLRVSVDGDPTPPAALV